MPEQKITRALVESNGKVTICLDCGACDAEHRLTFDVEELMTMEMVHIAMGEPSMVTYHKDGRIVRAKDIMAAADRAAGALNTDPKKTEYLQ